MPRPASISLAMPKRTSVISSIITSPLDAESGAISPRGIKAANHKVAETSTITSPAAEEQPGSPDFTSLPPFPTSPKDTPKHTREPSKGFFSNLKASKSSNKVYHVEPTIRQVSEDITRSDITLNESSIYSIRKSPGSTPDLSLSTFDTTTSGNREGMLFYLTKYFGHADSFKKVK